MADARPEFRLGRFRTGTGGQFSGVVIGDDVVALRSLDVGPSSVDGLLTDWPGTWKTVYDAVSEATATGTWARYAVDLDTLTPLAPFTPGQVFQSGANYRTHVEELIVASALEQGHPDLDLVRAQAAETMRHRAEHGTPYVFTGLPSAVCGPRDDVVLPPTGTQHDWELELGVVIGRHTYRASRADALDAVAGYVIVNDITTRDRVFRPDMPSLGTDWLAGKNAPTFLPLGPWLAPAPFVDDPMDLRITLALNSETMQDASTADMIFDIAQLIEHISAITPLRPGDLLATGSPAGNGAHYNRYLRAGDVMESSITGLGSQRNRCVDG